MSRAIFLRFSYTALFSSFHSGFVRAMRLIVFFTLCLGLSACVEGVDLPEFITSIQDAGEASTAKTQKGQSSEARKQNNKPRYVRSSTQVDSMALLEAKGNWNLVEQGGAMDPTQAHLTARKNVNVRRRETKKELSAHFEPDAKSGEDGKMRVLRMEREGETFGASSSQFDLAETSVVKPTHTVAENELLQKIKTLFGEEDAGSKSMSEASGIILPPRKPSLTGAKQGTLQEEQAHMISGIVVPPALPVRKIPDARVSRDTGERDPAQRSGKGVVRPPAKPVISAYEHVQRATSEKKGQRAEAVKIRSGKHKGKTRLVIEITKPTEYKVAIDHVRKVLRVKLENTHWAISPQDRFDNSALLGTYIARDQSDGSALFEVRLEKQSKIIDTMLLRPNLSSQHRIVIDLKE